MKLYQITESDLEALERELPEILSAGLESCNDPLTRKRWAAVKEIASNIRWNYGPPVEVKRIEPGDESLVSA